MPSRAARWISWITLRSNSADSRSPGRQPRCEARRSSSSRAFPSVSNSVISDASGDPVPGPARSGGRQARTQGGCNARTGIAPIEDAAWRSSGAAEAGAGLPEAPLVRARVVDLEVVQPPRRAVAAELARLAVVDPRPLEQLAQLTHVALLHLLLHAVRPQTGDLPANVEMRLVDGVAEGVAGVAADHEAPLLRHEAAHVPDRAADHDVHALHR